MRYVVWLILILCVCAGCRRTSDRIAGRWEATGLIPAQFAFSKDGTFQMQGAGEPEPNLGSYQISGSKLTLFPSDNPGSMGQSYQMRWLNDNQLDLQPIPDAAARGVTADLIAALTLHLSRKGPEERLTGGAVPGPVNVNDSANCASHVKQLNLAIAMYTEDYDQTLPLEAWQGELNPYIRSSEYFNCPGNEKVGKANGYAFNSDLFGAIKGQISSPEATPTIFDTDIDGPDAAGTLNDLPRPPRHPDGNTIGYLDGHVASVR